MPRRRLTPAGFALVVSTLAVGALCTWLLVGVQPELQAGRRGARALIAVVAVVSLAYFFGLKLLLKKIGVAILAAKGPTRPPASSPVSSPGSTGSDKRRRKRRQRRRPRP